MTDFKNYHLKKNENVKGLKFFPTFFPMSV